MTTRDLCRFIIPVGLLATVVGCGSSTSDGGGAGGRAGSGGSAGTGGGAGNGGSGSGGASGGASGATCIKSDTAVISKFDTDNSIVEAEGRKGGFYVYGDDKGKFDPPKDGDNPYPIDKDNGNTCSGPGAFHLKATGFGAWGAATAVDFVPKSGTFKGTFDASKYKGVSFWAKAAAPITGMLVSFPDIYTDGGADPAALAALDPTIIQACVYNSAASNNCSPYMVKFGDAQFPDYQGVKVNTEWQHIEVKFADTRQDKYNAGYKTAADVVDLKHLTGMAIQVNAKYDASGTASPNDFELWVDDIYFIE
jgi:hypothetical protein